MNVDEKKKHLINFLRCKDLEIKRVSVDVEQLPEIKQDFSAVAYVPFRDENNSILFELLMGTGKTEIDALIDLEKEITEFRLSVIPAKAGI